MIQSPTNITTRTEKIRICRLIIQDAWSRLLKADKTDDPKQTIRDMNARIEHYTNELQRFLLARKLYGDELRIAGVAAYAHS